VTILYAESTKITNVAEKLTFTEYLRKVKHC